MSDWFSAVRIIHIMSAVFMAAPLYMLIVVNERTQFGKPIDPKMDGYSESIITHQPRRCYIYLGALFVTGIALFLITGQGLGPLVRNWMVATKIVLALVLLGLLTYVHTVIQPLINALVARSETEDVGAQLWPLRRRRKRLSAICLFLVVTIVLLGVRLVVPYSVPLLIVFVVLAALLAWRAFGAPVPWGFV